MKKYILGILSLFISVFALAQEAKIVEVEGVGFSEKSALKDAARNAVQTVVGQVVDSTTIVKNEEDIEDKIISVSTGFVEKMDIISSEKNDKGQIKIKVKARVSMDKLGEKLVAYGTTKAAVDMKSQKAAREIELNTQKGLGEFLLSKVDDYMKLHSFDILKFQEAPNESGVLLVKLRQNPMKKEDFFKYFYNHLEDSLGKIGIKVNDTSAFHTSPRIEIYNIGKNSDVLNCAIFCFPSMRADEFGTPFKDYYEDVLERYTSGHVWFNSDQLMVYPNRYYLRVACKDADSKLIAAKYILMDTDEMDWGLPLNTFRPNFTKATEKTVRLKIEPIENIDEITEISAEVVKGTDYIKWIRETEIAMTEEEANKKAESYKGEKLKDIFPEIKIKLSGYLDSMLFQDKERYKSRFRNSKFGVYHESDEVISGFVDISTNAPKLKRRFNENDFLKVLSLGSSDINGDLYTAFKSALAKADKFFELYLPELFKKDWGEFAKEFTTKKVKKENAYLEGYWVEGNKLFVLKSISTKDRRYYSSQEKTWGTLINDRYAYQRGYQNKTDWLPKILLYRYDLWLGGNDLVFADGGFKIILVDDKNIDATKFFKEKIKDLQTKIKKDGIKVWTEIFLEKIGNKCDDFGHIRLDSEGYPTFNETNINHSHYRGLAKKKIRAQLKEILEFPVDSVDENYAEKYLLARGKNIPGSDVVFRIYYIPLPPKL